MSQFIYANNFRMAINESEVSIEFLTMYPVQDESGSILRTEVVGEPVRVTMNKVLASSFSEGLANGLTAQPSDPSKG